MRQISRLFSLCVIYFCIHFSIHSPKAFAGPYVTLDFNAAFIVSASDRDNGGTANNLGGAVGYSFDVASIEFGVKNLVFINDFGNGTSTELTDFMMAVGAKYHYLKNLDIRFGIAMHNLSGLYFEDGVQLISQIDGATILPFFSIDLKYRVYPKVDLLCGASFYKVNEPIAFMNIELGIRYTFF
ncbi:MAG: hypothetical protein ISR65_10835 [Bacteriovoracaceae bacterium]|nr:hypothetical protein [Bacteriovoracaceae bacterium]